jgi:hypothetical protein
MKKLNLDALQIESFETGGDAADARGTVAGHARPTDACESVIRCSGNCPSAACSYPYC